MLFADMKACFSPSVHSTYRKAWGILEHALAMRLLKANLFPVSHGGSLTHAESEFYEAHYFFCDGLGDPWLPDLASRRLIVRHPQWIAQCVSERAIMPIAAFTLDSRFESEVIESTQRISQEFIESYKVPGRPGSDVSETSANNSSRHKTNLRKRPLLDDTVERARVVKRSRIFTGGDTPVTPLKPCLKSSLLIPRSPEDEVAKRCDSSSPCLGIANAVNSGQESEMDANVVTSALLQIGISEHMAFWESVCSPKKPGRTLNLQIEDVLRAPVIRSTLFRRGDEYMGKPFHVNRKGPSSKPATSEGKSTSSVLVTPERCQTRGKRRPQSKAATPWLDLRKVARRHPPRPKRLRFEV